MKVRTIKLSLIVIVLCAAHVPAGAVDILPTAVGNKWEYACVKLIRATIAHSGQTVASMRDASSGLSVYEIVSVDDSTGRPVYDYRETTKMRSVGGATDTDKDQLKITRDDKGLRVLEIYQESSNDDEPDHQIYDPPLLYYANGVGAGKSWELGTVREGETSSFITARSAGTETVTVPAGTFKDCLKVIYSSDKVSGTVDMWEKTFDLTSGKSLGIYWIADGVGVVKELEVSTSTAKTKGSDGKPVTIEAASCIVSELKPGYVVTSGE